MSRLKPSKIKRMQRLPKAEQPSTPPPVKRFSSIKEKSHAEKLASLARHPRKAIQKVNVERQSRKALSYRQGMARYKKSATWKAVEARANGRCEQWTTIDGVTLRCPNTRADGYELHHHHRGGYQLRFGGGELASDVQVLCRGHHMALHAAQGKSPARFALVKKPGGTS